MQKFHRSYRKFLVFLHVLVNVLSSAAGVSKRCQGSSKYKNLHKVACWNTSHACGGSLLPCVCREEEPSALTDGWPPTQRGECTREPQAEAKAAEHRTAASSHKDREAAQHLAMREKLGSSPKFISPVMGDQQCVKAQKSCPCTKYLPNCFCPHEWKRNVKPFLTTWLVLKCKTIQKSSKEYLTYKIKSFNHLALEHEFQIFIFSDSHKECPDFAANLWHFCGLQP